MVTNSSILAKSISWTEGGLQSVGHKESGTTEHSHTAHGSFYVI